MTELTDYQNCIANLPNSILRRYGAEQVGETLPLADEYLCEKYKKTVVLLLDGLGTYILENDLPEDSFLRRHFVSSYRTVFPPTTVAATTSVISGLQPVEHAWFGWDCYYPQIDKNVTVFLNTEQGTENKLGTESVAFRYCGYESVVDKLQRYGAKAYNATPFMPPFPDSFDSICRRVEELCAENESCYIYAYWNEPDTAMHLYGCLSDEAKNTLSYLDNRVREMCERLSDTLVIITADHGHIDGRNVVITDYPDIMECLVRMPSFEPRALNLFVRENMKEQFENAFRKHFGEDFILLTKAEVYEKKLFGTGTKHHNADGMIGDYIAVALTDLTIFNTREEADMIKGVHAGYTTEEMNIPFIVFGTELK